MVKFKEGDKIENFEAESIKRGKFKIYDVISKNKFTILYFYPRDFTSGCTNEAISFRDYYEKLKELGAEVIGISTDDLETHKSFAERLKINFDLISDKEGKISEIFGVLKKSFGKISAQRVTFILDREGKIIKIFKKVDAKNHAKEVLEFLESYIKTSE